MRGGAQAHLLEVEGGDFYVVKFAGNPQHSRVLVNEWIASVVLTYLDIATPFTLPIEITSDFLQAYPEVCFRGRQGSNRVEPGWHFGSRYPGNPALTSVYDFMPDCFLTEVCNVRDFAGCLVFDKWTCNADLRQSVFYLKNTNNLGEESPAHRNVYRALMIDNGLSFNGPHWKFFDSPIQGLYPHRAVYDRITSLDSFQPWLERVRSFPKEIIDLAIRQMPPQWIADESTELEKMLERLMSRCRHIHDLVSDIRQARFNPFTNWK